MVIFELLKLLKKSNINIRKHMTDYTNFKSRTSVLWRTPCIYIRIATNP